MEHLYLRFLPGRDRCSALHQPRRKSALHAARETCLGAPRKNSKDHNINRSNDLPIINRLMIEKPNISSLTNCQRINRIMHIVIGIVMISIESSKC